MAWRHAISAAIKTKDTRHEQRQRQDALEWRIHIILTLERIRKPKRHWKKSAKEGEGWRVKGLSVWQIVDSRSISTIALTVAPRQRQQELPFIMLGECGKWRVYHAIWFWPYAFSVCTLLPFAHCLPLFLATVNPLALTYVFPSHPVSSPTLLFAVESAEQSWKASESKVNTRVRRNRTGKRGRAHRRVTSSGAGAGTQGPAAMRELPQLQRELLLLQQLQQQLLQAQQLQM